MAFITFKNGKTAVIPRDKALELWRCMEGLKAPESKKQELFISAIKKLYLNRDNAPDDYLEQRKGVLQTLPTPTSKRRDYTPTDNDIQERRYR